jgi:hypothetical protein
MNVVATEENGERHVFHTVGEATEPLNSSEAMMRLGSMNQMHCKDCLHGEYISAERLWCDVNNISVQGMKVACVYFKQIPPIPGEMK